MELYAESDSYHLHLKVFQTSIGVRDDLHTVTSDLRAWWHVIFEMFALFHFGLISIAQLKENGSI